VSALRLRLRALAFLTFLGVPVSSFLPPAALLVEARGARSPLAEQGTGHPGPAARSYRQKAAVLARFKGNNTRRPLFFSACVGIVLVNNISARKNSRRGVGGPAQRLQAAVEQLTGEHSTPTLDFFRAISAGEYLVVSIVTLYGAKLN
jgi:hypothetical protein